MKLKIPFFSDRVPGRWCGQTCAAMMIKYFKKDFEPDFKELNRIIKHKEDFYTFPAQISLLLDHYGIETKCYSSDDYKTTKEDPRIFHRWFGDEYDKQIKKVDIPTYNWMVTKARKKNLFIRKRTSLDEILKTINDHTLATICIDDITLQGKSGPFEGHFVVISGIEGDDIFIHDPDRGPFNRYPKEIVEKAYNHPIISDDCVFAFGPKEKM